MHQEALYGGRPIRSLQTMLRVIASQRDDLPSVIPDGIYGASTMQAVTAFQRAQGLPATGVTDQSTWEHIVKEYDQTRMRIDWARIMQIGDPAEPTGPYIYLAQSLLTGLSLRLLAQECPEHTGIMDSTTRNALSTFQALCALPETGNLDPITWKSLIRMSQLSAHRDYAMADIS